MGGGPTLLFLHVSGFHVGCGVFLLHPQVRRFIPVFFMKILLPDLGGHNQGRESEERRCFGGKRPLLLPPRQLRLRGSERRRQVPLVVVLLVLLVVAAVRLAEEDSFTWPEHLSVRVLRLQLMRLEAPVLGGMSVMMEPRFFRVILASF